jgi:hypothetical protein
MFPSLVLTAAVVGVLLTAGELVGRRLVPSGPIETRTMSGAGVVMLWLAGSAGIGLLVGGGIRWWLIAGLSAVLIAAVANIRSIPNLARSLPIASTAGLAIVATMAMSSPFVPHAQTDQGAIYEGRIPNRPADNRLPYRTGQFILHRLDPATEQYFIDWSVTDRTPLTAAAATTIVGAISTQVPADQLWLRDPATVRWAPQDEYGYWLYRSVLIAFSALLPMGVAAMGIPWLGKRIGTLAAIVSAGLMFSLVETMFTWPKFTAVALGVTAVGLILLKHPWFAGVLVGAAYLAHPVGAIAFGAGLVAGWVAKRIDFVSTLKAAATAGITIAPWVLWVSLVQRVSSRMVLYPIGWVLSSGHALRDELPDAIQQFADSLPWGPLRDRWTSLWESASPTYFVRIIGAPFKKGAVFGAYDRTIPGMVGLVGLIPLTAGLVESVRRRKGVLISLVTVLALALAFWGVWPRGLGADMLQPAVPFLALAVALGMVRVPVLAWLLPVMSLEAFVIANYTIFDGPATTWSGSITVAAYGILLVAATMLGIAIVRPASDPLSALRWFGLTGEAT